MNTQTETAGEIAGESIISYKGFDPNLKCRGFQFRVGETYEHDGPVKACYSGFHACTHPLDVFDYYEPSISRFALVRQSGELSREDDGDSKVASGTISIIEEISVADLIDAAVEYAKRGCPAGEPVPPSGLSGESCITQCSDRLSVVSSKDRFRVAVNTGFRSVALNTHPSGVARNDAHYGVACNTGQAGAVSNKSFLGISCNTGNCATASNTAYKGLSCNTGYNGLAWNEGKAGLSCNVGEGGLANNTAESGVACSATINGSACSTGKHSLAVAFGAASRAMAAETGAIVLAYFSGSGEILHIRASKIGENGIEPGRWYMLNRHGDFIEVEH
jgi:hypothetical protein